MVADRADVLGRVDGLATARDRRHSVAHRWWAIGCRYRDVAVRRDAAQERAHRSFAGLVRDRYGSGGRRRLPSRLRPHREAGRFEGHGHRAVDVRSVHPRSGRGQPFQRSSRGVAVRIAGPGGCHRDLRSNGREEGIRRRGLAAVVRDLEEIHRRQALREQRRIDVLLDVPGQQEAPLTHDAEQDHGHVVDATAGIGRFGRHLAADGP
jgi:hypothetical protein